MHTRERERESRETIVVRTVKKHPPGKGAEHKAISFSSTYLPPKGTYLPTLCFQNPCNHDLEEERDRGTQAVVV